MKLILKSILKKNRMRIAELELCLPDSRNTTTATSIFGSSSGFATGDFVRTSANLFERRRATRRNHREMENLFEQRWNWWISGSILPIVIAIEMLPPAAAKGDHRRRRREAIIGGERRELTGEQRPASVGGDRRRESWREREGEELERERWIWNEKKKCREKINWGYLL